MTYIPLSTLGPALYAYGPISQGSPRRYFFFCTSKFNKKKYSVNCFSSVTLNRIKLKINSLMICCPDEERLSSVNSLPDQKISLDQENSI